MLFDDMSSHEKMKLLKISNPLTNICVWKLSAEKISYQNMKVLGTLLIIIHFRPWIRFQIIFQNESLWMQIGS